MKYLFTTASRLIAFLLLVLCFSSTIQAQKTTHSPYSRYGIGLLNPKRTNSNMGAGGVGFAWRPENYKPQIYDSLARSDAKLNDRGSNFVNLKNPASFSNFSLTAFEAGIFTQGVQMTSGSQSRTESTAYLSHMTLAMPLGTKWGTAFGIRPYSSLGYDYHQLSTSINGQLIDNVYEGDGGVNQIFLGFSKELSQHVAIGITGNYLFGTLTDNRRVVYEGGTNFFNTLDNSEINVSDFSFDFGVQYFKNLNSDYRFVAGLTASPISEIQGKRTRLVRNYAGIENFENFKDTVTSTIDQEVSLDISSSFGGGFSIEKRTKWVLALDYTFHARNEAEVEPGIVLGNNSEINLGFEKFNTLSSFGSYLKQMGYRAGLRYNSSLMTINGENIQEFGISFGTSMPLRKSFSTLNLGIELGRRGKDEQSLTEESFFNLLFGVTINDKWFIQRKYD